MENEKSKRHNEQWFLLVVPFFIAKLPIVRYKNRPLASLFHIGNVVGVDIACSLLEFNLVPCSLF
jgi:hypothetical protein